MILLKELDEVMLTIDGARKPAAEGRFNKNYGVVVEDGGPKATGWFVKVLWDDGKERIHLREDIRAMHEYVGLPPG